MKLFFPRAHLARVLGCARVERCLRAAPLRSARPLSCRLCRRLSCVRILDAVVLHHADSARLPFAHVITTNQTGFAGASEFEKVLFIFKRLQMGLPVA